jgi:hypothetical protein
MRDDADKSSDWLHHLPAIAFVVLLWSMVVHKASGDISVLAQKHSGVDFWVALGQYFLRNLAGG